MSLLLEGAPMPKVTVEYLSEKRAYILECTGRILKDKPLYLVTMRDIIKEAGFSQGAIYRYYANLDEIYVDFINRHTQGNDLEQRIDALLSSNQPERVILFQCIAALGEFMETLLKSVGGRVFFELIVTYSHDAERRALVSPRLRFQQSLEYAENKIVRFAMDNVDKGIFRPQIPVTSIIDFIVSFMDGIALSAAINKTHSGTSLVVTEIFQTLALSIIGFLEDQENELKECDKKDGW
jgi:AcrR family transcriptional regulator